MQLVVEKQVSTVVVHDLNITVPNTLPAEIRGLLNTKTETFVEGKSNKKTINFLLEIKGYEKDFAKRVYSVFCEVDKWGQFFPDPMCDIFIR